MAAPSKLLTTLLFGTGLGAGPYGVAVAAGGVPTTKEITEEREENKFGEVCLLDEEMCAVMRDTTPWVQEDSDSSDSSTQKPWEKLDGSLLKKRWDDVCVWGFHDETLNTLANCKPEERTESTGSGGGGESEASGTTASTTRR